MKRIITNENFWTMNEEELEACIKAYKHNGWWWYTNSDWFDCQREYDSFICAYNDYLDVCEEDDDVEPMFVTDFYFELVACGMGEE